MSGFWWIVIGVVVLAVLGGVVRVRDRVRATKAAQQSTGFVATKEFSAENGFVAFDKKRKLVMIGQEKATHLKSKVYGWADIVSFRVGIKMNMGISHPCIDITINDFENPNWQIYFARNSKSAQEVASLLEVIHKNAIEFPQSNYQS